MNQIHVQCKQCLEAIAGEKIGVGQLFRYLNILPSFTLLDAGHVHAAHSEEIDVESSSSLKTSLRRHYLLSCSHFSCEFVEVFEPHFLDSDFHASP